MIYIGFEIWGQHLAKGLDRDLACMGVSWGGSDSGFSSARLSGRQWETNFHEKVARKGSNGRILRSSGQKGVGVQKPMTTNVNFKDKCPVIEQFQIPGTKSRYLTVRWAKEVAGFEVSLVSEDDGGEGIVPQFVANHKGKWFGCSSILLAF